MPPISVQGQGPKAKARGPKGPTAGVGFLCRGQSASLHQLGVWEAL